MQKGDTTTFGLNRKKLAYLLNLGSQAEATVGECCSDDVRAELLQDHLAQRLPLEKPQFDLSPAILAYFCTTIELLHGETVADLLRNSKADITLIREVKQYAKLLSKGASSKVEHDAATAVYYAAIAHALVYHNLRISRFSYDNLASSLGLLSKAGWVPKELKSLFGKARDKCRKRRR